MAKFIQKGDAIDYTPGANVAAGSVVVIGTLVGIADRAIADGELAAISLAGVYAIEKITGAITAGAYVYWDADGDPQGGTAGTGGLTTTKADGVFAAIAIAAAAETDGTVLVKLVQSEDTDTVA